MHGRVDKLCPKCKSKLVVKPEPCGCQKRVCKKCGTVRRIYYRNPACSTRVEESV